ncbi:MAG: hypothetical protein MPL62_16925 [Alphaproteobacteria bacterium]|nr:hypothetical protein [Alphaproteobacteria bacterium]
MVLDKVTTVAALVIGAKILESGVRTRTEERCRAEEEERTTILKNEHRSQLQAKDDAIENLEQRLSDLNNENRRLREKISEMEDRERRQAAKPDPGSF